MVKHSFCNPPIFAVDNLKEVKYNYNIEYCIIINYNYMHFS